jgi:hypothetical protein
MQTSSEVIPARSKRQRQAMDWSLVLLSQGIESTIEQEPAHQGWHLLVHAPDYDRALSALQQYRIENQRPFWQQPVLGSGLLFDWACLLWLLLLIMVHFLRTTYLPALRPA